MPSRAVKPLPVSVTETMNSPGSWLPLMPVSAVRSELEATLEAEPDAAMRSFFTWLN